VPDVDAFWIDEEECGLGPLGAKGIGEIGVTVAVAVHHATDVRVREMSIQPDKLK